MGDVVYGNSTRRLGLYWLAKFGGLPCSVTTLTLPHSPRIITCKVGHAGTLDPMATGVLVVGTLSLVSPALFAHASVWSWFGMGYLFVPLVLPVFGIWWLVSHRPQKVEA